jgi:hypothetical protein
MSCQNFADTSSASIAYVKQVDCGVYPTDGYTSMRFTSSDLQFTVETAQSEEIRPDRNVSDLIRTASSVSGTIGYELSYKNFDEFIQAVIGSPIPLDGAGTPIVNDITKTYFTFETSVAASGGRYYNQFFDCEIDSMTFEITQGAMINGQFSVMGRATDSTLTSIDTVGGYDPATTDVIYNAVSMVSAIQVNGVDVGSVQALTIDINNNMREQRAIGNQGLAGVGSGQFVVTGTMSIYFANNDFYEMFLNDELFAFYLELDDHTGIINGNKISIEMPSVKFGNVTRAITGNNQDVMLECEYQVIYDAGIDGTISIATTAAADVVE